LDLLFDNIDPPNTHDLFRGSGTLISNVHVLTTAHNLVNFLPARWPLGSVSLRRTVSRVVVRPGRNGASSFGSSSSVRTRICPQYQLHQARDKQFDYGLITLPAPIGASRHPALRNRQLGFWSSPQLGGGTRIWEFPANLLQAARVNTSGYPADKCLYSPPVGSATQEEVDACAPGNRASTQWRAEGRITDPSLVSEPGLLSHNMDTVGGQSGSPIWLNYHGFRYLVGIATRVETTQIHSGRLVGTLFENRGVRITNEVLRQLRRWMREDGITPTF
jgi:V8-like Glu-specific endopeptidase